VGRARRQPGGLQLLQRLAELPLRGVCAVGLRASPLPERLLHWPERVLRALLNLRHLLQLLHPPAARLGLLVGRAQFPAEPIRGRALRGEPRGLVFEPAVQLRLRGDDGAADRGAPLALLRERILQARVQVRELGHALLVLELAVHRLRLEQGGQVVGVAQGAAKEVQKI